MSHVAVVIPTIDEIGGAERQVLLLVRALAVRDWRVTLIVLSGTGQREREQLDKAGVKLLCLGMRKAWIDPRGWMQYLRWARKDPPDVVHAHLPHAVAFARWARLLRPVRIVVDSIHTSRTPASGIMSLYRTSNWLSDQTICVSRAVAEAVCASGIAENVRIIVNAVVLPSEDLNSEGVAASEGGKANLFRWIAVGRLAPVKDYPTLIRGFAALTRDQSVKAELTILGCGPEEQSLRALTIEMGVHKSIHFAGFCTEIDTALANADAFVLTSLWEGLPVSLLEAQAIGLPVVATAAAGTREAMIPGVTGFTVPVGDIPSLTEAMARIMNLPICERREMGKRGRRFIEKKFQLKIIASEWDGLYRELLQMRPRQSRTGRRSE